MRIRSTHPDYAKLVWVSKAVEKPTLKGSYHKVFKFLNVKDGEIAATNGKRVHIATVNIPGLDNGLWEIVRVDRRKFGAIYLEKAEDCDDNFPDYTQLSTANIGGEFAFTTNEITNRAEYIIFKFGLHRAGKLGIVQYPHYDYIKDAVDCSIREISVRWDQSAFMLEIVHDIGKAFVCNVRTQD